MINTNSIEKFISFIGAVRTGHSLVASILSTHPNIAISLELNPLLRFQEHLSRNQLFDIIVDYCENKTEKEKGGYIYNISNSIKKEDIKIIGDSMSNKTKTRLLTNDKLIERFSYYINIPIIWFWVIRNPFDCVNSCNIMNENGIEFNVNHHCNVITKTSEMYNKYKDNSIIIYLEDFICNFESSIERIMNVLDLTYNKKYIDICSNFIFNKPHKMFNKKDWNNNQIESINNLIETIPELNYYKKYRIK